VTTAPSPARRGYPGSNVAAAVIATLFFPVLSLIAALVLLGREADDERRRDLRTWAWSSGGWIAVQAIVFVAIAAVLASSSGAAKVDRSGPCVGGPELGKSATVRADGTAVVPCSISGTATITVGK
jgi:hypothetical protein